MRRLTLEEMTTVCGGRGIPRRYDSTDFSGWDEASTGDYEWALQNFMDDVSAGVNAATAAAATQAQAEQMARDYLASVGLASAVSVNSTQPGDIVITGTRYELPALSLPALNLSINASFTDLDAPTVFEALDESAHTVDAKFDRRLTEAEKQAIATFQAAASNTTAMLNLLAPNGYFLKDGKAITVADLKEKWSRVDIVLTENKIFTNGGVGEAQYNNGYPTFEVNIAAFVQFMSNPQSAKWWALHELVHVTVAGDSHNRQM